MRYFNTFHPGIIVRMLLFAFALSSFSGCSKDELTTTIATVIDTGPFATGGCSWTLSLVDGYYEPHNLPDNFKTNGLLVEITYSELQNTANCPNALNYKGLIHLHRIKQIQ